MHHLASVFHTLVMKWRALLFIFRLMNWPLNKFSLSVALSGPPTHVGKLPLSMRIGWWGARLVLVFYWVGLPRFSELQGTKLPTDTRFIDRSKRPHTKTIPYICFERPGSSASCRFFLSWELLGLFFFIVLGAVIDFPFFVFFILDYCAQKLNLPISSHVYAICQHPFWHFCNLLTSWLMIIFQPSYIFWAASFFKLVVMTCHQDFHVRGLDIHLLQDMHGVLLIKYLLIKYFHIFGPFFVLRRYLVYISLHFEIIKNF